VLPESVSVLMAVVDVFERLQIPYMVAGSMASALYGVARSTLDADVVAVFSPEQVGSLVEALGKDFYADDEMIYDAIYHRSSFNLIHLETMFKVDVVQMLGTVGRVDSVIDGPDLARELASKLGGHHLSLHAPLFVDSATTRDLFLQQPTIAETLDIARGAHAALVGVGTTEPGKSSFLRAGHLTEEDLEGLRKEGVVGESGGQHFDINGTAAGLDINRRVIGLSADEIRCLPNKIAVACGLHKTLSIIGALRGGYVNVLATDDVTARAVLSKVGKYD